MFERSFSLEEKYGIVKDLALIGMLFVFAFIINSGLRMSGLYMDDLYMWSCYGEQSFTEYIFPIGSTRFRPVYWFAAWVQLGLIQNRILWIVPFNIIFAGILAGGLYLFGGRLSRSRTLGFIAGAMFLLSRFSYYNIGQLLGFMEALALFFLLIIIYRLYKFLREKNDEISFLLALVFYLLISFTHERYMVLLPLFFYVLIAKRSKDFKLYAASGASFVFIQLIRYMTIGSLSPAGTDKTYIQNTFSFGSFLRSAFSEILYLFGINAGPEHLNGITWQDTDFKIKISVLLGALFLLLFVIRYLIAQIYALKKNKKTAVEDICLSVFLLAAIAGCIAASAVTIRVEMRWIYAPYLLSLLFLSHMYGVIKRGREIKRQKRMQELRLEISGFIPIALVLAWSVLLLPAELYYRAHYNKIYLFPDQSRINSLADVTYGKYKSDIFGKKIYIIGNYYQMSEFYADTFFKVFDKERKAEGTEVYFVDSYRDFGQVDEGVLVIKEDAPANCFVDVTKMIRDIKCEVIKGYYKDGWLDQEAELNIMAGEEGLVDLEFLYPGEIQGNEVISMLVNGKEYVAFELKNNISYQTFYAKPYEVINIRFSSNFYLPDAQEIRGETPLCTLMNISSE